MLRSFSRILLKTTVVVVDVFVLHENLRTMPGSPMRTVRILIWALVAKIGTQSTSAELRRWASGGGLCQGYCCWPKLTSTLKPLKKMCGTYANLSSIFKDFQNFINLCFFVLNSHSNFSLELPCIKQGFKFPALDSLPI